ncbi:MULTISPECIES: hypothetical protein [Vibrio]|uniref:hypothetical protein n=1 Tax=Vibrio TaxID=662 RepID=UPI0006808F88|nr:MULTISPECIES: hypothetical protein [Vibrio]MDC5808237.1 hypothetical protein [Vibrio europaeus]PNM51854.1 hypothetical protein AL469_007155 [Vibrio harveyi]HDM8192614.1 hypothetical protein [Vibrio harveyi]
MDIMLLLDIHDAITLVNALMCKIYMKNKKAGLLFVGVEAQRQHFQHHDCGDTLDKHVKAIN